MVKIKFNSHDTFLQTVIHVVILAVLLDCLVFESGTAHAQNSLEPTQILVGAPAQSNLGKPVTVQALLADSRGHPISKAVVYFTTRETFLGDTKDVVLAQAVTNANGQAVADFLDNFTGSITFRAEFHGDAQYAASNATAQTAVAGAGQVYVEHIGVDIPGYNVPPMGVQSASLQSPQRGISDFIQNLWPAMTGWPIAAILLLVWSMYLFAVKFVFRIAGMGTEHRNTNDPMRLP